MQEPKRSDQFKPGSAQLSQVRTEMLYGVKRGMNLRLVIGLLIGNLHSVAIKKQRVGNQ